MFTFLSERTPRGIELRIQRARNHLALLPRVLFTRAARELGVTVRRGRCSGYHLEGEERDRCCRRRRNAPRERVPTSERSLVILRGTRESDDNTPLPTVKCFANALRGTVLRVLNSESRAEGGGGLGCDRDLISAEAPARDVEDVTRRFDRLLYVILSNV